MSENRTNAPLLIEERRHGLDPAFIATLYMGLLRGRYGTYRCYRSADPEYMLVRPVEKAGGALHETGMEWAVRHDMLRDGLQFE